MKIPFTKMHGLGNDFIVIDDRVARGAEDHSRWVDPDFARKICDRRFGVGADQILWLRKPQDPSHEVRMEILNSDGSVAEMCGNGIRAVAIYLSRYGSHPKSEYRVETLAGTKIVRLDGPLVAVDMGPPVLGGGFATEGEPIRLEGSPEFKFFEVSMGNPHAVIFLKESVDAFPVEKWGPRIELHSRFPKRTNVEFVEVKSPDTIQVRVWERGAGITLACGTGACGAAVAAIATQRVKSPVNVDLPGGRLRISWAGGSSPVVMEGPATEVFHGEFPVS